MNPPLNNGTAQFQDSNLPTSLDITSLLSRLTRLENECSPHRYDMDKFMPSVKCIELDSYYRSIDQSFLQNSGKHKIRLFFVVAFGNQFSVAQLFALELSRVDHHTDVENDEENSEYNNYEWIDVSHTRVASVSSATENVGDDRIITIFPPFYADPSRNQNNEIEQLSIEPFKNGIITCCALIPSPAIRVTCSNSSEQCVHDASHDKVVTERLVAVVFGSSRGQVFYLIVNISCVPCQESSSTQNNVFIMEYYHFKCFENETLEKNELISEIITTNSPVLYQILPSNLHSRSNIQVVLPSYSTQSQCALRGAGVASVLFIRGHSKSCLSMKRNGRKVLLNQDIVWITFEDGHNLRVPSWRLFLSTDSRCYAELDTQNELIGSIQRDVGVTNKSNHAVSVVPLISSCQSPLDIPYNTFCEPSASYIDNEHIDFDEASVTPNMSSLSKVSAASNFPKTKDSVNNEVDYLTLLASVAYSNSTLQIHMKSDQSKAPPIQALVLASQSESLSSLPISFQSSRVEFVPQLTVLQGDESLGIERHIKGGAHATEYTSNSSRDNEFYGSTSGTVMKSTTELVKGAVGAALGAIWGLGKRDLNSEIEYENESRPDNSIEPECLEKIRHDNQYTSRDHGSEKGSRDHCIGEDVIDLFPWPLSNASLLFGDIPRRFEKAVLDPTGSLVATTDNLGRVMLFELETQQPIRMLKGMRNVTCTFSELPHNACNGLLGQTPETKLYLLIHSQQKGTVEVYRLRQGPRVATMAVAQQKNCIVLECFGPPSEGARVTSFLLEKITNTEGYRYVLDYLVIDDGDSLCEHNNALKYASNCIQQEQSKIRLNLLVQLLTPDTNIISSTQTILKTFKTLDSLSDLGKGMDIISKCHMLELKMGVEGSSFHSQVLSHCKDRLNLALRNIDKSEAIEAPIISELSSKISFHEKLVRAYNILHRYEVREKDDNIEEDADDGGKQPPSMWASEAVSWMNATAGNAALSSKYANVLPEINEQDYRKPLNFSKFAAACCSRKNTLENQTVSHRILQHEGVYLSEIMRDRQSILRRIFHPLLENLFVFKVVHSIFLSLGIDDNFLIQQQYFGEWFLLLSPIEIAQSNLSGTWRPMLRWLQELILKAYDLHQRKPTEFDEVQLKSIVELQWLMNFCIEMEDLSKAFLLAVICMDAVSVASKQIEERAYGKIIQADSIYPWEVLLRKLRVLLLVSLRLSGNVNPIGVVNSMTIKSVSNNDLFSIFSWIARDELSLSHDNQVIMALEKASLSSSLSFYPSTVDGDSILRQQAILESCSHRHSVSLLNPSGLTNDHHSRPLLFYFKDHANCPFHLAAHRALILGSLWGQAPENMPLLKNAIHALELLMDNDTEFTLATTVEFYQTRIRPVCRAIIFGFHDVHDFSRDVLSPLIDNVTWMHEFSIAAKRTLSMIITSLRKQNTDGLASAASCQILSSKATKGCMHEVEIWPPLRNDPVLHSLISKQEKVNLLSAEVHLTVIFAHELMISLDSLESIVLSVTSLFLVGSLFSPMPALPKGSSQQYRLLDDAIAGHAKKEVNPIMACSAWTDIELVAQAWSVDMNYIRTRYFIEMIRLGKDAIIDDILASNLFSLKSRLFLIEVVPIICERLDLTITSMKRVKKYRGLLSLLDADTSLWVRDEAKTKPALQNNRAPVSLVSTHSLLLRMRRLCDYVMDKTFLKQIDALSQMSGTLLEAVQEEENQVLSI